MNKIIKKCWSKSISNLINKQNFKLCVRTLSNSNNDDQKSNDSKDVLAKNNDFNSKVKEVYHREPGLGEHRDIKQVIKDSFKNFGNLERKKEIPLHCDVLIIGGGIMGLSTAFWLKNTIPDISVVIVERDIEYTKSSTFWSVGGFRQQFSLPENISMSLFGLEFMRNAQKHLNIRNLYHNEPVDLPFNHDGYLFLASNKTTENMIQNHKIQLHMNAKVKLYNPSELKEEFKWLDTDGVELGSFGFHNEGWVDPRKYLMAMRNKVNELGVHFAKGELIEFEGKLDHSGQGFRKIHRALIDNFNGVITPVSFNTVVNAAGPWAADVARLAGIGVDFDEDDDVMNSLKIPLPVEKRKRYIYMIKAGDGPLINVPLTIDSTGVFFRRHGLSNLYLCGRNQDEASEPKNLDLNVIDYDYFHEVIKPVLIKRVPSFKNLELVHAWAGYYEYNTFDQNLIIGPHHIHTNLLFANGSSGHGLQHAAAIGLALTEFILYGNYRTIDLKRFGFERVLRNAPLKEIDVI